MTSIPVPENYGYVILSCIVLPFVTFTFPMGGMVMSARKDCDVKYPNLYAVPGFHKEADKFNRIQRGHQNALESLWLFVPSALLGGLKHPIAVAVEGVLYSAGMYLYQAGYANTNKNVEAARHTKGGPVKYIGLFGALGACISLAGSLNKWW